ncbi:MAG TPA: dihydrodipicolinate reductase C-terminal domain-containing protein [Solirubrobacteraceae bacterium]|jgi:4-hydroxy-tetrahydrodipicolinate reductase|nr:dihydrodipicolinate reductase C-terminal domain-containing protein [Solirubrobacteraceae bacterium]
MIRVAVAGAAGRMGETVCAAVEGAEDMELSGRADPVLGTTLAEMLTQAEVVVDFTRPDTALENALACVRAGVHAVIGTTGFDLEELRRVCTAERDAAAGGASGRDAGGGGASGQGAGGGGASGRGACEGPRANVLVAPNFAIGAVLMMRFAAEAARHMAKAEIVELHHDRKLDVPSGTAARTAALMAAASGSPQPPIHSVRLPGLVAHQEVILGDLGQTLTIRHDSIDRESFMPGVLLAVRRVGSLPEPLTVGLDQLLFEEGP